MDQCIQLDWDRAYEMFLPAQSVVILGHTAPDADAICSILSLEMLCKSQQKSVTKIIDGGVSDRLFYIPGADTIEPDESSIDEPDLIIVVDSSAPDVVGAVGQKLIAGRVPKLIVDHHASNALFGDAHLVRSTAVSTTEVIYDWYRILEQPLTPELADILLIGLLSDTQLLSVGNIDATTFEMISGLVSAGADFRARMQQMARQKISFDRLHLIGLGLHRAQQSKGVAWTWLEASEFENYNHPSGQTLNLVDTLLQVEEIVITAEFAASIEGHVKLSLRAVDGYNVGQIATNLGGGGHQKAGGCLLQNMTTKDAIDKVLPLLWAEANKQVVQER